MALGATGLGLRLTKHEPLKDFLAEKHRDKMTSDQDQCGSEAQCLREALGASPSTPEERERPGHSRDRANCQARLREPPG